MTTHHPHHTATSESQPPRPSDIKLQARVLGVVDRYANPILIYVIMDTRWSPAECLYQSWDKRKAIARGRQLRAESRAYWIEHDVIPELKLVRDAS